MSIDDDPIMIESVMMIAIGFLLGGLAALSFMPVVHNRAVRLTQRALEADLHPSKAEIQCHKDLLSAEFAFSMRRAEIAIEGMRRKLAGQMVEIAKRGDTIAQLKIERNALNAELGELKELDGSKELGELKNEAPIQFELPSFNKKRFPRRVALNGGRAVGDD